MQDSLEANVVEWEDEGFVDVEEIVETNILIIKIWVPNCGLISFFFKVRSMKRARDIRDQLEGLLERVEIELTSNSNDLDAIKKAITSGMFTATFLLQTYCPFCLFLTFSYIFFFSRLFLSCCSVTKKWCVPNCEKPTNSAYSS